MSKRVGNSILNGVLKVTGFVTSTVMNCKPAQKFFKLLPGVSCGYFSFNTQIWRASRGGHTQLPSRYRKCYRSSVRCVQDFESSPQEQHEEVIDRQPSNSTR